MHASKTQFLINLATQLTKNNKPVIYIAGKVTGLPEHEVATKFDKAQKALEERGFKVLNPCQFISNDTDWRLAMRFATSLLNMADYIYLLNDWKESEGAIWEYNQAVKFGISFIHEQ
jgi:hypothetical protein